jgi:hypothetical protein
MPGHDGAFCAGQDDAFHKRASVLPPADHRGMKSAEPVAVAFPAFEDVRLLPAGK